MTTLDTTVQRLHECSLPIGWRRGQLSNIAAINPPRPRDFQRSDSAPTTFVPMQAVNGVTGTIAQPETRRYEDVSTGYTYFREGDVLFAKITPCMQNGKHVVARDLIDGIGFASTEFHVIRPGDAVLAEWLHFFIRQPSVLHEAANYFTGAVGQQRVPDTFLERLQIPLPSLPEQQRITAKLREQMTAVEKARSAAQVSLEAADALPSAFLRTTFESSEAARWPTKRLGHVLVPHKEIIHPGDRKSGTATFVGLEHLESHTGRRIGSLPLDLARLTGRKPTFRRGQIVYGYLRPYLNKVWIAEFDGCSSVDQFAYEVRSELADPRFVAWFMRSPTYLRRSDVVTTTGQLPRIGTEQIAAVEIGLPSLDEQHAIAEDLDRRFATHQTLRKLLYEEAYSIERMPAACLRQAFAGKQ